MILLDANMLLYAVNRDAPHHAAARTWLETALSGNQPVGLAWVVILAFLRISTNRRIFEHPLEIEQATQFIDEWLEQPVTSIVLPGQNHWRILQNLVHQTGTGGNLTTDAHIAALCLEHGASIASTDNDFKRFAGLKHINPLQSGY